MVAQGLPSVGSFDFIQRKKIVNVPSSTSSSPQPLIMGILNCTPDSFSDGHDQGPSARVQRALDLVKEGADWIDVGGESTRPGAEPVSLQDELLRVIPVIEGIREHSHVPISIDTSKAEVAAKALNAGANLINDVTAGRDPDMKHVAAQEACDVVLMHMQGTPKTMQIRPQYKDVLKDIQEHLLSRVDEWIQAGVQKENIALDPGIGFGKSLEHNLCLLRHIGKLSNEHRILLGSSRKSFIAAIDDSQPEPQRRLGGSLASIVPAIQSGVTWLRVHDVYETKQFLTVLTALQNTAPPFNSGTTA